MRATAPLVAKASALLSGTGHWSAEELGMTVAAQAIQIASGTGPRQACTDASSLARVTRVVRLIDEEPGIPHDLASLSRIARLSAYHFLRTFQGVTGTTPHQYVLRARLRSAALRLKIERARILDIALACGFGDVSNFNRTFRAEFGVSPRAWRSLA
jgi:AraC-like DNA-binding protein